MLSLEKRVDVMVSSGRGRDALHLLNERAEAADPDAMFVLGLWRVSGTRIQRDLSAARELFRRSGDNGHTEAALYHAYFVASGVGGPSDWADALARLRANASTRAIAARQLELIGAMRLVPDGMPSEMAIAEVLSTSPAVSLIRNFLSPDEAAYIMEVAAPNLHASMIVDPVTGRSMHHPIRRSDEAVFGVFDADLVISAINRRIAAASATLPDQGEPLTVLRYQPGGEYRAHSDALPGTDNQRIATLILYLNSGYQGGQTRFVETGLTISGQPGDALLFRNVSNDSQPDPMSRHAGLPISAGSKWIATRWLRSRTFTYAAPKAVLA